MAKEPTDYRKLLLAHMPDTIPEIARKARVGHKTVRRWLIVFKRPEEPVKVGVVDWTSPKKGPPAPIFGPTTEPDVPRPVPMSNAEKCARYLDKSGRRSGCLDRFRKRHGEAPGPSPVRIPNYRNDPFLSWVRP